MKKTFLIMLVISLGIGNQLQAARNSNMVDDLEALNRKVTGFLKVHHLDLEEEIIVDIHLKVNEYNELVVLGVNSKDKKIRDFICASLTNKVVGLPLDPSIKSYNLPVRIKPKR